MKQAVPNVEALFKIPDNAGHLEGTVTRLAVLSLAGRTAQHRIVMKFVSPRAVLSHDLGTVGATCGRRVVQRRMAGRIAVGGVAGGVARGRPNEGAADAVNVGLDGLEARTDNKKCKYCL